jgi:uncharacterized surface protein with fasciclin (FAS1) repeats
MPNHRLLTAVGAFALLTDLSAPAWSQTAEAKTEKAAAAATGKATTDAPAATAVQGAARAVSEAAKPAQATAPTAPAAPTTMAKPLVASGDITATLRQSAQFTTFVKALDATNLAGLLQRQPGITVFAPTDAAFAALPPGKLDALWADKTALQKLLLHHLINAKVDSTKIKGARGPIPSGAGDQIVLDGSTEGVLKADNATIIQADVTPSNGTIHVVDQVLIAGSVPAVLPEAAPPPEPAPAAAPPPPAKPKPAKKKK